MEVGSCLEDCFGKKKNHKNHIMIETTDVAKNAPKKQLTKHLHFNVITYCNIKLQMYYLSLLHLAIYIFICLNCLYIRDGPHLWCGWEHFNRGSQTYHWSVFMEGFFTTLTYIRTYIHEIIASLVLSLLVYNSNYY